MAVSLTLGSDYLRWLPTYLLHQDFIDGSVPSVRKYLIKHASENLKVPVKVPGTGSDEGNFVTQVKNVGQSLWKNRNDRLANENFCEPVLMHWMAALSQEIERGEALTDERWEQILADVDGMGAPLDVFVRNVEWDTLGLGRTGVLIEGPADDAPGAEESRAEGKRAYVCQYEPELILKAERFTDIGPKRGKFKEVILVTGIEGERKQRSMIVRRYWIEKQGDNYQAQDLKIDKSIFDSVNGLSEGVSVAWEGEIMAEPQGEVMAGRFDEIPFVLFGDNPAEDSVLYSVVPRNREYLNKKSVFDTINYYQAHQKIIIFGAEGHEIAVWNESCVAVVAEANGKSEVIEGGNPVALKEDMADLKRDAFLIGLLRPASMNHLVTRQVEAADTKREDNATFEKYLEYFTDRIQAGVNQVIRYLWLFEMSEEPDKDAVSVKLGDDFKIQPTDQEIAEQQALYFQLRDAGQPGREAQGLILATKFLEQRIASGSEEEDEDTVKADLAKRIREEMKKKPDLLRPLGGLPGQPAERPPSFSERVNGNGQPPAAA